MTKTNTYILLLFLFIICFLSLEKVNLSFEISRLHSNQENLRKEYEDFKDTNLKLITQFNTNNSPASIEKTAKEELGMIKRKAKKIYILKAHEED
jgi:cell division protein FtsL